MESIFWTIEIIYTKIYYLIISLQRISIPAHYVSNKLVSLQLAFSSLFKKINVCAFV